MLHPFQIVTKPAGPMCNMDCTYCFYLGKTKLYPGIADFRMSDDVLESFISQYIENNNSAVVQFIWQGGEPTLLSVDFYRTVVALQQKYANGKKIENAFQTNGIVLNDEWCTFFKEYDFLVGLSIDGPEELHNKYRVGKNGQGTFKDVMRGLKYLKKYNIAFNTLTVVQNENSRYPLKIYNFLKEVGNGFMQFIPVVERNNKETFNGQSKTQKVKNSDDTIVTEWSVKPLAYGQFLSDIFDEWVRKDVGKQFVQIFDIALAAWSGMEAPLCVFRKICGDALALEHNGDLFSCDHFVYPEHKLGNIIQNPLKSLVYSKQQKNFGLDKLNSLPQYCKTCDVRFVCNGGCPKNRFKKTPDGESGLNYLCAGYQKFFRHIDPYMRFMVHELRHHRPPANVMEWIIKHEDR